MDTSARSLRTLSLTLLTVLVPLLAAALCLGAYLNYASVRTSYLGLVGERMEAVSRRIAADAHTALGLGLPLAGQSALERTLTREKEADPGIGVIDVVGATGRILFSTDPARIGSDNVEIPDDPLVRAAPIASVFGTIEGDVHAHASRSFVSGEIDRLFAKIGRATLLTFLCALVVIVLLILLSVRALGRRLTALSPTARGRMVPAEMAPVVDAVDSEHDTLKRRMGEPDAI
ncbi:MAG: hypothetical protein AcusKO_21790 [Acuticoccus sp.]